MKLFNKFLAAAVTMSLLVACGSDKEEEVKAPQISAVQKMDKENAYDIVLPKDMMGLPHLLSVSVISGIPAPTGSALANKIVTFEKRNDNVVMFESLEGRLSSSGVETKDFLAKFPIVGQTAEGYVVDFEKGFDLVFAERSMHVSDGGASTQTVYEITHSFVDKAELKGRYAIVEQYVRVNTPGNMFQAAANESMHVKYAFTPYVKSATFEPKVSTKLKKVGYFENHPVTEKGTGKETIFITRFDTSKPITYYVTNNVPKQFKKAVYDGVTYWNKVFGKEVITVSDLPEDVQVHDPGYNVVQWLNWDTAGFAYANLHADPLTGETLQALVYMTSSFGTGSLKSAKFLLKRYLANKNKVNTNSALHALTIKGFDKHVLCERSEHDMAKVMTDLQNMVTSLETNEEITDEEKEVIFQRFTNDYIRQVVAHEVGHTLGLRHNFAGSLVNNLRPDNYEDITKIYFLTGKVPRTVNPGSSVMDYTPGFISGMMGAFIREGEKVMSYDKDAIGWGYSDKEVDEFDFDPFCTDSSADKNFIDCRRFDLFADPVAGNEKLYQLTKKNRSFSLASKYEALLEEKTRTLPLEKRLKMIKQTTLEPRKDVASLLKDYYSVTKTLSSGMQFLSVRETFPETLTAIDEADYQAANVVKKQEAAEKLADGQGMATFLFNDFTAVESENGVKTPVVSEIQNSLMTMLDDMYGSKLEAEEMTLIQERFAKYFEVFEMELQMSLATSLVSNGFEVTDPAFGEKLTEYGKSILLSLDKESVVSEVEVSEEVTVPTPADCYDDDGYHPIPGCEPTTRTETKTEKVYNYYYQYQTGKKDLRMEASKLVAHNFYPTAPSFNRDMAENRKSIYKEHKKVMDLILSGGRSANDLEANLFDWYTFETQRFAPLKK